MHRDGLNGYTESGPHPPLPPQLSRAGGPGADFVFEAGSMCATDPAYTSSPELQHEAGDGNDVLVNQAEDLFRYTFLQRWVESSKSGLERLSIGLIVFIGLCAFFPVEPLWHSE